MSILLGFLTVFLIFVSVFLIFVVLMQKSKDGGMGAALGGGAAEAAFGADTTNVLSRSTIYAAILFFGLAFTVYLGRIYERKHHGSSGDALPVIAAPAALPLPAAGTPPTSTTTTPATVTPPITPPIAPVTTAQPEGAAPAGTDAAKKP